jgi:hypothetical protein
MTNYLKDSYMKEINRLSFEVKELENEKQRMLSINPNHPLRSLNPKLGAKKRKLKLTKKKYEATYNV